MSLGGGSWRLDVMIIGAAPSHERQRLLPHNEAINWGCKGHCDCVVEGPPCMEMGLCVFHGSE